MLPVLIPGEKGKVVRVWQVIVDADLTGVYDKQTEEKTIQFQRANNLKPDGIVESFTWSAGLGTL